MSRRPSTPSRRRPRLLAAAALLAGTVMGCGEARERSLCDAFATYQSARTEIQAIDATTRSADDAVEAVDDYLGTIRQLAETTDGRFRAAVDDLDAAVANVVRTLESVPDDADYATWAPLVEDSIEDAESAADRVDELIEPQCTTADEDEEN